MRVRLLLLLLVGIRLGAFIATAQAAPPSSDDAGPFKALVQNRLVLTCGRERGLAMAFVTARKDGTSVSAVECMFTLGGPLRWHVGSDAFWIASPCDLVVRADHLRESAKVLDRFQLADLWKGKALSAPETLTWNGSIPVFGARTPASDARDCGQSSRFDYRVHCDYLPGGPLEVRQFVLTNTRGRVVPAGELVKIVSFRIEQTAEEQNTPEWSFTVHRYRAKWDPKEKCWQRERWRREATLPVVFREPFFCLGSSDDWYFLTHSGRLFHAPPAPRGGDRKLVPVWDDPRRPIEGQIQDNTGRTFLFVPATGAGKPACFELSAKPKLVEYDPDRVPYLKAEEPLRRILHRVAVLETLKLLPAR